MNLHPPELWYFIGLTSISSPTSHHVCWWYPIKSHEISCHHLCCLNPNDQIGYTGNPQLFFFFSEEYLYKLANSCKIMLNYQRINPIQILWNHHFLWYLLPLYHHFGNIFSKNLPQKRRFWRLIGAIQRLQGVLPLSCTGQDGQSLARSGYGLFFVISQLSKFIS